MQIGQDKVVKVMLGANTLFDVTGGWQQLRLGKGVTGIVLAKVNSDNTVSLTGSFIASAGIAANDVVIYGNDIFDFASIGKFSVAAHLNSMGGDWERFPMTDLDGNIVSTVNNNVTYAIGIYSDWDGYQGTDMSPVTFPIIRK